MRGQGGEEVRRWEKGPWNPVMGFAQQFGDYNNIHKHQRGGRERPSSAHQRFSKWISNSGKKTDVMSLIFTQRIKNWNYPNDSKRVQLGFFFFFLKNYKFCSTITWPLCFYFLATILQMSSHWTVNILPQTDEISPLWTGTQPWRDKINTKEWIWAITKAGKTAMVIISSTGTRPSSSLKPFSELQIFSFQGLTSFLVVGNLVGVSLTETVGTSKGGRIWWFGHHLWPGDRSTLACPTQQLLLSTLIILLCLLARLSEAALLVPLTFTVNEDSGVTKTFPHVLETAKLDLMLEW